MRWRSVIWLAALAMIMPGIALAQTATPSILALIAQYESSDNPTAQSSTSSASGLYGDINSIWAEALADCGCGSTAEYPTAASAPASVQTAANAALIDQNGLSDWLCAGCDAPLAAAIAADDGVSAFDLNLSTNPADYASLDTADGFADFFGGDDSTTATAGGGGLTVSTSDTGTGTTTATTDGTIASAAAAGGVTATGNHLLPYSWLWSEYQTAIAVPIQSAIGQVETMVSAPLQAILSLSVMMFGVAVGMGRLRIDDLTHRFVRIAVVVAATGIGSVYYQEYVVNFFNGLPNWFATSITGATVANPGSLFDQIGADMWAHITNTWWNVPKLSSSVFLNALIILVAIVLIYVGLTLMFIVVLITNILMQLVITLGPLLMVSLAFDYTRAIFDRWMGSLIMLSLVTLGADIVGSVFAGVIKAALGVVTVSGEPLTDCIQLLSVAIVTMTMATGLLVLPRILESIVGAAGATLMAAGYGLVTKGAKAAGQVAGTAGRGAGRAVKGALQGT